MRRDYVLEFVWLMQNYQAAGRSDVQELLRTPSITRLIGDEQGKAAELVAALPDSVQKEPRRELSKFAAHDTGVD
jgi:hypothetical protein